MYPRGTAVHAASCQSWSGVAVGGVYPGKAIVQAWTPRFRLATDPENKQAIQSDGQSKSCGSPVVKVSDHGRHVMSSSPVPLKTRRVEELMHVKSIEAQNPLVGVV
ncbi:hypothetical protein TNCV_3809061 [Trichonephila clavipes]|nr:hypothetical protein TNCV_3809061 [Trichonephila clavipes]